jgi:tetratricopeptide (TPR) repeat protein
VPNIALFALTFAMTGTCVALSAGKKASDSYTFSFAKDQKKKIVAASVSIALALAIICFGCVTAKRFIAEVYASKAAVSLQSGSIDDSGTAMSKALAWNANDRYYRAMADLYMSKAATLLSGSDTATDAVKTEAKSLLGSAYQSALLASTYDGSNYLNWMELGRFYQTVAPLGLQDAYANAKTSYVKALALNPTNPSIYLSLANLDLSQKNVDMAKEDIAGALAIKPDYTDALFLLAKMAQDSGDTQEAIRQVQKAQAADPTSFAAAFDLGILEYAVKDYTHAATSLEQAVAIDQSNLDAHYFLGLTYDTLGRKDDAIAQFEFIAQAHPDNQQIKDILANLKAGRSAIEAAPKPTKK